MCLERAIRVLLILHVLLLADASADSIHCHSALLPLVEIRRQISSLLESGREP